MQNPGQMLLRVWLRVHDRPFQHLEVHKADGLLEHHAWVKNKQDWIIGERSNTFKLQTSNTRLKRARKRQGRNSLLQKRIVHSEIMYKENNELAEVWRIFCYACMNVNNKEHDLQRSIIGKHLTDDINHQIMDFSFPYIQGLSKNFNE